MSACIFARRVVYLVPGALDGNGNVVTVWMCTYTAVVVVVVSMSLHRSFYPKTSAD